MPKVVRIVGSVGAGLDADKEVAVTIRIDVSKTGYVEAGCRHRTGLRISDYHQAVSNIRRIPCADILEKEEPRLEEIAPEQIEIVVGVYVIELQRVGSVPVAPAGNPDDRYVLECLRLKMKERQVIFQAEITIMGDRSRQRTHKQIRPTVSVDIGQRRDHNLPSTHESSVVCDQSIRRQLKHVVTVAIDGDGG